MVKIRAINLYTVIAMCVGCAEVWGSLPPDRGAGGRDGSGISGVTPASYAEEIPEDILRAINQVIATPPPSSSPNGDTSSPAIPMHPYLPMIPINQSEFSKILSMIEQIKAI
ncbi:MAG: hypothetical protein K6C34_00690 [Alphaproteobacteria bacterium]|nr:hypothetical protein [Alphaproteobacteria bacterium]